MSFDPLPVDLNEEPPEFGSDIGDKVEIRPCWVKRPVASGRLELDTRQAQPD